MVMISKLPLNVPRKNGNSPCHHQSQNGGERKMPLRTFGWFVPDRVQAVQTASAADLAQTVHHTFYQTVNSTTLKESGQCTLTFPHFVETVPREVTRP